jgi:hypothetical protein
VQSKDGNYLINQSYRLHCCFPTKVFACSNRMGASEPIPSFSGKKRHTGVLPQYTLAGKDYIQPRLIYRRTVMVGWGEKMFSPLFNQVGQLRTSSHLQLRPGQDKAKQCDNNQQHRVAHGINKRTVNNTIGIYIQCVQMR